MDRKNGPSLHVFAKRECMQRLRNFAPSCCSTLHGKPKCHVNSRKRNKPQRTPTVPRRSRNNASRVRRGKSRHKNNWSPRRKTSRSGRVSSTSKTNKSRRIWPSSPTPRMCSNRKSSGCKSWSRNSNRRTRNRVIHANAFQGIGMFLRVVIRRQQHKHTGALNVPRKGFQFRSVSFRIRLVLQK